MVRQIYQHFTRCLYLSKRDPNAAAFHPPHVQQLSPEQWELKLRQ